jgi:hypothetical protein
MASIPHHPSWPARLLHTGTAQMAELGPMTDAADPDGTVSLRSRLLCAGLSELGSATYAALGGARHGNQVARAASLLSLLTKIDDQVIDSRTFHGGWRTDRDTLRDRTRRWLAPTLASVRSGTAATPEPRCELAAELGRALRSESFDPARRDHVLEVIARGWEIQVQAVVTYTAHPSSVPAEQIDKVTADISGAWLLMIALCGTLPHDAARGLTADEERAFFTFGGPIQQADALADLGKDAGEGLIATVPGQHTWHAAGERYLTAVRDVDERTLYQLVARHDADLRCLPPAGALEAAAAELGGLGDLPALLRWIHGFLLTRYLDHPCCERPRAHPAFLPHAHRLAAAPAGLGTAPEAPCSGR